MICKYCGQSRTHSPFADASLAEACLTVLSIRGGLFLDKYTILTEIVGGGYRFTAKHPVNSVEITLRNLAKSGKCIMERGSGRTCSRYAPSITKKGPSIQ